jgi:hypothetical protein
VQDETLRLIAGQSETPTYRGTIQTVRERTVIFGVIADILDMLLV